MEKIFRHSPVPCLVQARVSSFKNLPRVRPKTLPGILKGGLMPDEKNIGDH